MKEENKKIFQYGFFMEKTEQPKKIFYECMKKIICDNIKNSSKTEEGHATAQKMSN